MDKISDILTRLNRSKVFRSQDGRSLTKNASKEFNASAAKPSASKTLKTEISQRLQSIDLNTPAGKREGRMAFFETVIRWEFRELERDSGSWSRLSAKLDEEVGAEKQLCADLDKLVASIKSARPKR